MCRAPLSSQVIIQVGRGRGVDTWPCNLVRDQVVLGSWGHRIWAGLNISDSLQPALTCSCEQQGLGQLAVIELRGGEQTLRSRHWLCFHIWARIWQVNNMLRDCPPAAASLSICHESNNNVLSPQACSNTCCPHPLLANSYNNQSPRVRLCPENWTEITGLHRQHKSLQSDPSLYSHPPFPPFAQREHYRCISFSGVIWHTEKSIFFAFSL